MKWEHFVSKLEPGQKETWTAVITGPDAKKAVAEMVAALYDESLDAYLPHNWPQRFGVFRQDHSNLQFAVREHGCSSCSTCRAAGRWTHKDVDDDLPLVPGGHHRQPLGLSVLRRRQRARHAAAARRHADGRRTPAMACATAWPMRQPQPWTPTASRARWPADKQGRERRRPKTGRRRRATGEAAPAAARRSPDLSKVAARKNLNETAFFFPHLIADEDGVVKLEFTMPEALTAVEVPGLRPRRATCAAATCRTRRSRPRT